MLAHVGLGGLVDLGIALALGGAGLDLGGAARGKLAKAHGGRGLGDQVLQPLGGADLAGGIALGKLHRRGVGQRVEGGHGHILVFGQQAAGLHLRFGKAHKTGLAVGAGFFGKRCGLGLGIVGGLLVRSGIGLGLGGGFVGGGQVGLDLGQLFLQFLAHVVGLLC